MRRFLVHGFTSYSLPVEGNRASIKINGKMVLEKITTKKIKELTETLHELNTGHNGVCGEFRIKFKRLLIGKRQS